MTSWTGTTTFNTTGVFTLTPGFPPKEVEVKVSGYAGGGDDVLHFSLGWSDGIRQNCDTVFADGTNFLSKKFTNKLVSLWADTGNGPVEVLAATFNSFTAAQVKFNVITKNIDYQVSVKCSG